MGAVPRGLVRRIVVKSHADHWGAIDPARKWQPSRKQSKTLKVKKEKV